MIDRIQQTADEIYDEVVQLRRTLHQHPELAFEEHETARRVAEALEGTAFRIERGVAETGIVATLEGARPGPTLALRADMDALPIREANEVEYASRHDGRMHACGHDAHTASLVGTALILDRHRDELDGAVRLLFQPSEEKPPGGAQALIEAGALGPMHDTSAPQRIYGQHAAPDLPAGTIGIRSGWFMASADELYVTIRGEGGHAAAPHELRSDAVLAAAHVITSLQSIVSRNCPPGVPSILSIGRVMAEGATNVLPDEVKMEGTFRAMDESWRRRGRELIRRVIEETAAAQGAEADVRFVVGYPALRNDEASADLLRRCALEYLGEDRVVEIDRWFAGEDFAFYLGEIPGAFYKLGVRNEERGITHGLHTPRFDIDEEALRVGSGFMAHLALQHNAAGAGG